MIGLYGRLLRNARSINGLNRVHIALENTMSPGMARQLSPRVTTSPAAHLRAIQGPAADSLWTIGMRLFLHSEQWRERVDGQMAMAGKTTPEAFARSRLRRDVFLFSKPDAKGLKRLLILFAGGAERPMMPIHLFLQHLDSDTTDVLFLRDPARQGFRSGLFGVGSTIEDIIDGVPSLIDLSSYQGITTMGTSAGGVPALLAGLHLGAGRAVSVGGIHPSSEGWTFRGQPLSEALVSLRHTGGVGTKVALMCGAQSPQDQDAALATAELLGGSVLVVSDETAPVRHVALFPLAQQGHLADVLEMLLSNTPDHMHLAVPTLQVTDVRASS